MLHAYSFIRGYQSLEIYSVFRCIWNYDKLRCFRNANASTTWHKYGDKARLSHMSSSLEVPTDSVCAWNKAGEKRQITSFKVPLRDWWLGRYSKKKLKRSHWGATKASLLPQHTPHRSFLLVPALLFFLFHPPSPHFLSPYPAIPLITTFWLPLPLVLCRRGGRTMLTSLEGVG